MIERAYRNPQNPPVVHIYPASVRLARFGTFLPFRYDLSNVGYCQKPTYNVRPADIGPAQTVVRHVSTFQHH